MLRANLRTNVIAVVMMAAIFSLPSKSMAGCHLCDWLFGKSCPSCPSQTTYVPI